MNIQFMKEDNDAVMAEIKVSQLQVQLSVASIKNCKEDEIDGLFPPDQLKIDLREETFLIPTIVEEPFPDLLKLDACNGEEEVDELRKSILTKSIKRIKIDLQASQGITASYRIMTDGKTV